MEAEQKLLFTPPAGGNAVFDAIAGHIGRFVGDGATLQSGVARIPDAVLPRLADRRDLRCQAMPMGDGMLALVGIAAPG